MVYTQITYPGLSTPAYNLFIFVSHLWCDDFWYRKIIGFFDSGLKENWENHSIQKKQKKEKKEGSRLHSSLHVKKEDATPLFFLDVVSNRHQ